jgi:hypothetical protein
MEGRDTAAVAAMLGDPLRGCAILREMAVLTEDQRGAETALRRLLATPNEWAHSCFSCTTSPVTSVDAPFVAQFCQTPELVFVFAGETFWDRHISSLFFKDDDDAAQYAVFKVARGYVLVSGAYGTTCDACTSTDWYNPQVYWSPTLELLLYNACTDERRRQMSEYIRLPYCSDACTTLGRRYRSSRSMGTPSKETRAPCNRTTRANSRRSVVRIVSGRETRSPAASWNL